MKWALCLDRRSNSYFVTIAASAKHFDFLEILKTGTYTQMIEARRQTEQEQK